LVSSFIISLALQGFWWRKPKLNYMLELLKEFYKQTGCPMVLNTSLNIKGQPIVNDEKQREQFVKTYGVKVY